MHVERILGLPLLAHHSPPPHVPLNLSNYDHLGVKNKRVQFKQKSCEKTRTILNDEPSAKSNKH